MTPDERDLIAGLFDRMRGAGAVDKDRDAEALINQGVRQIPDSAYMLVQSVLVQEHALQQAGQRIEELEGRVHQLEAAAQQRPAQSSGSFFGSLLGGSRPQPPAQSSGFAGSVPATGAMRQSPGYGQAPGSPWGQPQRGAAPAAGGGSFMRTAIATAAGVAGGMLLANSISSMMGGGSSASAAQATDGGAGGDMQPIGSGAEEPMRDGGFHQGSAQESSHDAGSDFGGDLGGDSWGGDEF
jgi:hypothetical protein